MQGTTNKGIISYQFDLLYDASVIRPQADPVDLVGTLSRDFVVVTNAEEAGHLRVVVYGTMPLNGNGVLMNLRFTAIAGQGAISPLTWTNLMLNEGVKTVSTDGQVVISAPVLNPAEDDR